MATRTTFVLVWLSAMVLLGVNIGISKIDLGPFAPLPIMLIAATQALLIVWFFLHVRRAPALVRLAALRGVLLGRGLLRPEPVRLPDPGAAMLAARAARECLAESRPGVDRRPVGRDRPRPRRPVGQRARRWRPPA